MFNGSFQRKPASASTCLSRAAEAGAVDRAGEIWNATELIGLLQPPLPTRSLL